VTDVNAIVNATGVTGASSGPAIRYDAVRLRRGRRLVLDGVTFQVAQGGVVVLMGPSGSGKTTILRTIAGLESFEQGCIDVAGVTLGSGPPGRGVLRLLRRRVGMVFQFHCLFEHMTVLRNVSLAPVHVLGLGAADAEQKARALLQSLGVEHRAGALPRELSGGEAQRVAIARALAVDPPVLLMDEPTASLDRERRSELAWLVRSLVDRHRTLVIATHDEEFARLSATRLLRVADGRVDASAVAGEGR
jgi:polar amino acid transport system ATP-binding protein